MGPGRKWSRSKLPCRSRGLVPVDTHCTPAWAAEQDPVPLKTNKQNLFAINVLQVSDLHPDV